MEVSWLVDNLCGPLISVPLIAGFLRFRTNSKSFITAIMVAILSTSISGYIVGGFATISLMCGMIGSTVGLFGMHYWQVYRGVLNVDAEPIRLHKVTESGDVKVVKLSKI